MPTKTKCPKCRLEMRIPDDFVGRTVKCPQCYERFRVPDDDPAVAPSARMPAAKFDRVVRKALQPDVIDAMVIDDDPALSPHPRSGPSHFWQCPRCQAQWEKPTLPASTSRGAALPAQLHCEACGESQDYLQVQTGKFDVPEIEITCGRCRTQLIGPPEALLGQTCPACQSQLPNG